MEGLRLQKFFSALFILFFLSTVPARAMQVSPTSIKSSIDPGTEQVAKIIIFNDKLTPARFELHVNSVSTDQDGKIIFGHALQSDAWHWLNLPTSTISILGRQSREIPFTIRVPAGARPGSHYAAVVVSEKPMNGQIAVLANVAMLLTIQVAGVAHEAVVIKNWSRLSTPASGSETFSLALTNQGNVEVPVAGDVRVTSLTGQQLYAHSVPLGNTLLAGSDRIVMVHTPIAANRFWPTRVRATFTLRYGITHQSVSASEYFWLVPQWWVIFASAFLVLLGGAAVYRRYVHKKV